MSISAEPSVAAVVVTHNRKDLLRQCLLALRRQTHPLAEIIVVDNASQDGTVSMIRSEFPNVTVRELAENLGGAGGFHEGMKMAASLDVEWIWVMDDDVEPRTDALEQLFSTDLQARKDTAALASLRVNPDGTMQKGSAGWYDPFSLTYEPVQKEGEKWEQIGYATFVGLLIRRKAVTAIGLPEAGYFIRGDDTEYVLRLSRYGNVYLVYNSIVVHHDASGSKQKPTALWERFWGERSIQSFWRQYYLHRNKILIARSYAETPFQRGRAYAKAGLHLLRSAAAILVFDTHKLSRLRLLAKALLHGVQGRKGKCIDPSCFSTKPEEELF